MDITLAVLAPPSSSLRKKSNKKEFELLVNDKVNGFGAYNAEFSVALRV